MLLISYQGQFKGAKCANNYLLQNQFILIRQHLDLSTFLLLTALGLVTTVLHLILAAVPLQLLHLLITVPLLTALFLLTAGFCWSAACWGDYFGS